MSGISGQYIRYDQVIQGAEEISQAAKQMNDIFNEVSGSMNTMTTDENFKGSASNALQAEFAPFRGQFNNYVNAVERFAALYRNAARQILASEHSVENQVNALSNGSNVE